MFHKIQGREIKGKMRKREGERKRMKERVKE